MVLLAWLLNPVPVAFLGVEFHSAMLAAGSALPLALALVAASAPLSLVEADGDSSAGSSTNSFRRPSSFGTSAPMSRSFRFLMTCSSGGAARLSLIVFPLTLLSMQILLYLPWPAENSGFMALAWLFAVSGKFCWTCVLLSHGRIAAAVVFMMLLCADWVIALSQCGMITQRTHALLLLATIMLAGMLQLRLVLVRLQLLSRWAQALVQRRAALDDASQALATADFRASDNALGGFESFDSDDERGPLGVPSGFYDALAMLLWMPPRPEDRGRRIWLCGPRRAHVLGAPAAGALARPPASEARTLGPSQASADAGEGATEEATVDAAVMELPRLDVMPADTSCAVCLEDIVTGQQVRPLPKCNHKFHSHCLEHWVATMKEETRCPTCRRPVLARRQLPGATHLEELLAASAAAAGSARRTGPREFAGLAARNALARHQVRETLRETPTSRLAVRHVEFQISVDRQRQEPLGLHVQIQDGRELLIQNVRNGLIHEWNCQHPESAVRRGDRIIEVNGVHGDADHLIALLRRQSTENLHYEILVRRLCAFRIRCPRPRSRRTNTLGRLGIDVVRSRSSLRVVSIRNGPFAAWNGAVPLDFQLLVGDKIVEVSGASGDPVEMLNQLRASTHLDIVVEHDLISQMTPVGHRWNMDPAMFSPAMGISEGDEDEEDDEEEAMQVAEALEIHGDDEAADAGGGAEGADSADSDGARPSPDGSIASVGAGGGFHAEDAEVALPRVCSGMDAEAPPPPAAPALAEVAPSATAEVPATAGITTPSTAADEP
eukprot:TRINITY_DN18159_c0_g1_i1.p1 TRINITY_DN18159_c0_g1~~TRINITY_DN18159_c0_g1_i1.p1  ORF type:complete len:780 (-),score=177.94 TRINITY_DN18159_c0_g1_i1:62-2401(-)